MGANEDLTTLLNVPNREEFLMPMDVEGTWPSFRETSPAFALAKKPTTQLHHQFADISSPVTPPFGARDYYSYEEGNYVGGCDVFEPNFLPDGGLESETTKAPSDAPGMFLEPQVCDHSMRPPRPPCYARLSSRPMYATRDLEIELASYTRPLSGQESDSATSSLESAYPLTQAFWVQERAASLNGMSNQMPTAVPPIASTPVISSVMEMRQLDPSLFANSVQDVESGSLPTMLMCPPHTLPQMVPPILPKLYGSCPGVVLPPTHLLESAWEVNSIGKQHQQQQQQMTGRRSASQPDAKIQESMAMQKSQSVPHGSCVTHSSTACSICCRHPDFSSGSSSTAISTNLNKNAKKSFVGKLSPEERQRKILKYKQKRNQRKFDRGVTYQCRKTLADRRPRVRGRFARNNDIHATFPKELPPLPKDDGGKDSTSSSPQQTSFDLAQSPCDC